MKLPKQYFENLSITKYRDALKLLPSMQKENTRIIVTLILTFTAMSFFGIFAINPTLSTIVTLKRQLSDSITVKDALSQKITNLSSLQQQLTTLNPDLTYIYAAVPQTPNAPILLAQIYGLSEKDNVQITTINVSDLLLVGKDKQKESLPSYEFTLQAKGPYDSIAAFVNDLSNIERIISIDSAVLTKEAKQNNILVDVKGRAFFKK